jgi:regulator of protease activity HflC (stomatin/prohibitin superfamily)
MRVTTISTPLLLLAGCAVVSPGERGIRQTLGKLGDDVHRPGTVAHWPFIASVVKIPVRTTKLEMNLALPSQEGVTVDAELSVLYRVKEDSVQDILETIGADYERSVVLTSFRSAAADIASRHAAKDMHSGARAAIEAEIADELNAMIGPRGFEVEGVLLKSIRLPPTLADAVQAKLAAEQRAQQMQFVLEAERREADRRRVEAEGIRDAQRIVDQGLSPLLIQWRAIEAFRELATSSNSKVIFTDGRTPLLVPQAIEGDDSPDVEQVTSPGRLAESQGRPRP